MRQRLPYILCIARRKGIYHVKGNLVNCCEQNINSNEVPQLDNSDKQYSDLLLLYKQSVAEIEQLKKECKNLSEECMVLKQKELLSGLSPLHDVTLIEDGV